MKEKRTLVFQSCFKSNSGYGEHARMTLMAFWKILKDDYDIKAVSLPWGSVPDIALDEPTEKNEFIKSLIVDPSEIKVKPHVFVQLSTPSEFMAAGHYNIGITAGIETTAASPEWLMGLNRMDLIVVPSNFSKNVFNQTSYKSFDQTGKETGLLRLYKPIEVVFEGVDLNVFGKTASKYGKISSFLDKIEEDFGFLFVGHWLAGDINEDRKNVSGLILNFLTAFKDVKNPPFLALKTSGPDYSVIDRHQIESKISKIRKIVLDKFPGSVLPKIYLIHGYLTKSEMNALYAHSKIKAHVSFTKGECWGLPLLEASLSEKPIIASNWGGHLDYLHPNYCVLVNGKLTPVHPSATWESVIIRESAWFTVDPSEAQSALYKMYKNYSEYKKNAPKQAQYVAENFSIEKMEKKWEEVLKKHLPSFRSFQPLKLSSLTQLKKIESNGKNENIRQQETKNIGVSS